MLVGLDMCPTTDWRPVHGVVRLLPQVSRVRLQHPPPPCSGKVLLKMDKARLSSDTCLVRFLPLDVTNTYKCGFQCGPSNKVWGDLISKLVSHEFALDE